MIKKRNQWSSSLKDNIYENIKKVLAKIRTNHILLRKNTHIDIEQACLVYFIVIIFFKYIAV